MYVQRFTSVAIWLQRHSYKQYESIWDIMCIKHANTVSFSCLHNVSYRIYNRVDLDKFSFHSSNMQLLNFDRNQKKQKQKQKHSSRSIPDENRSLIEVLMEHLIETWSDSLIY